MNTPANSASENPLQYRQYRAIWTATLFANISVWMQNVGAAWLMTALTSSPLMVALIQTATTLPAFLFGLPGGVLAEQVERRRLLLAAHSWMLLTSICLCTLLWLNALDPWILLLLTFMLGAGSALTVPAWQASTSDAVPRVALISAIALNGIAYNAARAVGPALAGSMIALFGSTSVFIANIVLFGGVVYIFAYLYKPAHQPQAHAEGMLVAIRTGLRYVRHAHALHGYFARTILFISCASCLWALLPLIAKLRPGFGASGYGILLGSLGAGAVTGGMLMNRYRARLPLTLTTSLACVVFAAVMLVAAFVEQLVPICMALFCGGCAWITFNSTVSAAFQTALPSWVRSRALAAFMLTFQGSMAAGAILWGIVAKHAGVPYALAGAAVLILCGLALVRHLPVRMAEDHEVMPHQPAAIGASEWSAPVFNNAMRAESGPLLVQHQYQVAVDQQDAFTRSAYRLGAIRRRNGANFWRIYRDLADPDCYIERFIVDSWAEYLRQQQRTTMADHTAEEDLQQFLKPGTAPQSTHYVAHPYPQVSD